MTGQQETEFNHLIYCVRLFWLIVSCLFLAFFVKHAWRNYPMMRNRLAIPALALALTTSGFVMAPPLAAAAPAFQDHDRDHDRDWNMPPQEFRDIQRQGYHDGIEGARKDYDNHRRPDVNNRDEYRPPHVPQTPPP